MIQIEYLPIILTGLGLTASILYYTNVLRNANKTRQAQLFMSLYSTYAKPETQGLSLKLLEIEMNGIDDWNRLMKDEDQYESWSFFSSYYEGMGVLVRDRFVDIGLVIKLVSGNVIWFWEKYCDGIYELRKVLNWPRFCIEVEYLYDRIIEYREENPDLNIESPAM
jgi:hypothetical protein